MTISITVVVSRLFLYNQLRHRYSAHPECLGTPKKLEILSGTVSNPGLRFVRSLSNNNLTGFDNVRGRTTETGCDEIRQGRWAFQGSSDTGPVASIIVSGGVPEHTSAEQENRQTVPMTKRFTKPRFDIKNIDGTDMYK